MDARQLVQGYYDKYPLKVVGIAKDYDDALKLIEQLTQECLHERGDCNLREYLIC
jgi:mannitol/fructose-specific phosphotransferase system IIA component